MAATSVDICNIALQRIGVKQVITSLAGTDPQSVACNTVYSQALNEVLTSFDWPFAEKRAVLVESTSEERVDWLHVYTAPTDLLKPRYLWPSTRTPTADQRRAFRMEDSTVTGDSVARFVLTDMEPTVDEDAVTDGPVLFYTEAVTSVPRFPPHFRNALEWYIAAELALAISVKTALEQLCRARYEQALARAGAVAHRTGQEDAPPPSRYLTARG